MDYKSYHYFTTDGTYGADIPLVVDTTKWTEDDWREIEDCSDSERLWVALEISKKYK
jgi:hypothetical protein